MLNFRVLALCQASGEASQGKFALILIVQIVWIRLYYRSEIGPWIYIYIYIYNGIQHPGAVPV